MSYSLEQLVLDQKPQRQPVIDGLVREGETCSIVAPYKSGISFLCLDLALAVCTGQAQTHHATDRCRHAVVSAGPAISDRAPVPWMAAYRKRG